ncbi:MAG: D-alanyl-D-alanine carboxypeptidase, partial [Planctomycetota bacterium]
WRSPQRDIFRNSLATPGGEGTLSKRFPDARLEGRLFAKTGTIAGVSALSGYAKGEDDRWRAFSVLVQFEGKGFSLADARRIEDRIAIEVAKGP